MHYLLLLFIAVCSAYRLRCPDATLAIDKGLHSCCENPSFCVLCARVTNGLYTVACTGHCNGTITQSHPYCTDCLCRSVVATDDDVVDDDVRGCPFMRKKKQ